MSSKNTFNIEKILGTYVSRLGKPRVLLTVTRPNSAKSYRINIPIDEVFKMLGDVKNHIVRDHNEAAALKTKLDMAIFPKIRRGIISNNT